MGQPSFTVVTAVALIPRGSNCRASTTAAIQFAATDKSLLAQLAYGAAAWTGLPAAGVPTYACWTLRA